MIEEKDTNSSLEKINFVDTASFNLYDNLLQDCYQKEIQKNLSNFIEADRQYHEILVQGKMKIDEQFNLKRKEIQTKKKISKSALINKHHMMKSQLRFKMCEEVFKSVLQKIQHNLQQNEEQYCLVLIKLIVEGALRMFEPELMIRCLPRDILTVQKVVQSAEITFNAVMQQQTGRAYPIKLKINATDALQQRDLGLRDEEFNKKKQGRQCIGGIILTDPTGDITYKNTIDARLNILKQVCLPAIRTLLWPNFKQTIKDGKLV